MDRDDVLIVVGVNNADGTNFALMSHNYNGTCGRRGERRARVRRHPGRHRRARPHETGAGRRRRADELADRHVRRRRVIVETARGMPPAKAATAERAEIVKAVLMAGAIHRATWTNNPATSGPDRGITMRPLDNVYGADTVNVDRSHLLLTSGSSPARPCRHRPRARVSPSGTWRPSASTRAASRNSGLRPRPKVSVIATWHRQGVEPLRQHRLGRRELRPGPVAARPGPASPSRSRRSRPRLLRRATWSARATWTTSSTSSSRTSKPASTSSRCGGSTTWRRSPTTTSRSRRSCPLPASLATSTATASSTCSTSWRS